MTTVATAELAQQLLESAPDAMVIVSDDGTIVLVNRQTELMFGYERSELLNEPVEILIPERFRNRHVQHHADYNKEPRVRMMGQGLDLFGRYRDGTEFPVEIMLSPVQFNGDKVISAAIRDITDRQLYEAERSNARLILQRLLDLRSTELRSIGEQMEAAETMASIGTVAAGLVHDLNNIIFPLRLRLEALHHEATEIVTRDHLASIDRTVDYIAELCKRIRTLMATDVSESGEIATDVREWWSQVQPLIRGVLPQRIELKADIPDGIPPVRVQRLDLTQAVFNLVHNAGRAMKGQPNGEVTIAAMGDPARATVRLSIVDNGPGMSDEVKVRCLDPRYTKQHKGEGTGLGLMLVRSIIERVNGSMDIKTKSGEGTQITLTLPAAQQTHD